MPTSGQSAIMAGMTAKELFRDMLRDLVGPALRERGFSGGSGKYYLTGETGHVGSLQMSGNPKRSWANIFVYDLHIGVTSTFLRESSELAGFPIRKKPSVSSDHDWFDGLGERRLAEDDDVASHASELMAAIDEKAIPRITRSLTDHGLRVAVDSCLVGAGRGWARLLHDIAEGNVDAARRQLSEFALRSGEQDAILDAFQARLDERTP